MNGTVFEVRRAPQRESLTWVVLDTLWQMAFAVFVVGLLIWWLLDGGRGVLDILGVVALVALTFVLVVRRVPADVRRVRDAFGPRATGEVVLRLDENIAVLNSCPAGRAFAVLAWADCAAVVCTALSGDEAIVQFVPSDDRRVVLPEPEALQAAEQVAQRLNLSLPAAAMAYPASARRDRDHRDVVAHVRLHHPEVRVMGTGVSP